MMFKTYESASVFNPLADVSEKYWSYIELTVNHPWFLVKILIQDDEYPSNSTLFLNTTDQLLDLDMRNDLKIAEVHVVSPPHKNKEKTWKMHQVAKILKGSQRYKDFDAPVFKYVFTDGNELVDSQLSRKVAKNTVFITLYSS